ncbi:MAG TPA: TlpA disulfide reductase family protein [Candidatus Dormibacteraeota bacterium]|nr:TlpA disulfide reductase family protein [Candidatus Dormibacteraeota bacterium]
MRITSKWTPKILILAAVLLAVSATGVAAPSPAGLWDAVVVVNKVEIPFRFEIDVTGKKVQGFFFEGDRKVGSTSGSFSNNVLTLNYDFLNTTLQATFSNGQLHGTYLNHRPKAIPLEFSARRFTAPPPEQTDAPKVAGSWDLHRTAKDNSKLDVSWRLYLRQSGADVSGAILRTSGDTGTLTGRWKDGVLTLSHFAGERPLLFQARLNPDGTLNITLDHRFTYRAARTSEARAKDIPEPPDPTRFTSVKDPTDRFHFSGLDLNGKMVTDADPRFRGKVVLLTVGGSWCPNCHDEAPFLVSLYKKFAARGLVIVGLNFELYGNLAQDRPRVLAFIRRYGIRYPMLVAGTPSEAAKKLSQLVNFGVFPTSIYLGRDGRVRAVHAGFASAATGEEHIRRENEDVSLIKQLLAEKP